MNVDLILNKCEIHLNSVKVCCNQYYDTFSGIKICNSCNNIVFDINISPYQYHYTTLCNFFENYYVPQYQELNKLGLRLWTELLLEDLLNNTNLYYAEFTINDFINFPRKYLLKLIYVYLIKNNIVDSSYF